VLGHPGYDDPSSGEPRCFTPNRPEGHLASFFSWHAGGANFLFHDGSVHHITENIDEKLWLALFTKAGNEALSTKGF
jgi:prepilin-type processing-associated H-X9-DG protein